MECLGSGRVFHGCKIVSFPSSFRFHVTIGRIHKDSLSRSSRPPLFSLSSREPRCCMVVKASAAESCTTADSKKEHFHDEDDYLRAGGSEMHFVQLQESKTMKQQAKIADKVLPGSPPVSCNFVYLAVLLMLCYVYRSTLPFVSGIQLCLEDSLDQLQWSVVPNFSREVRREKLSPTWLTGDERPWVRSWLVGIIFLGFRYVLVSLHVLISQSHARLLVWRSWKQDLILKWHWLRRLLLVFLRTPSCLAAQWLDDDLGFLQSVFCFFSSAVTCKQNFQYCQTF